MGIQNGGLIKKRLFWLTGIGLVLVVIVLIAGILYTSSVSSAVNPQHQAQGAATAPTTTPNSSNDLRAFQIVSAQTTASYSVYENLIFQNKPNNDAIGTTYSVQGSFKIRTGTSPLVASMNITVDLSTLQSDAQRRDNFIKQNSLQTDTYPNATFVSVSTQGLPSSYSDGQTVHFQL